MNNINAILILTTENNDIPVLHDKALMQFQHILCCKEIESFDIFIKKIQYYLCTDKVFRLLTESFINRVSFF